MKKSIAFALALVLLLTVTACGTPTEDGAQDSTTTTTTTTTVAGEGTTTATTTVGTDNGDTTATTVTTTTTATTTTTTYVPGGVIVPIGTKPTTTTTTKKPTTTTQQAEEPIGPTTTVTTTTTTQAPTTTVKPTEPSVTGPYIALPEVGSDIDVSKKKDRIRVSAVAAWYNDDGTIGVQLTFKNYSKNWITEETDYVEYTCYDKNGNVVQKATKLPIGVIDTKRHPVKEFTFAVPADTAEVRITKSKIVYWTEWA